MSAPCLLCGGPTAAALDRVRDTRFGTPGEWSIRRCPRCAIEQTDPIPTLDQLVELYERHYNYGGERDTAYTRARDRLFGSRLYRIFLALDGDVSFHAETGAGRLIDIGCNEGRGLMRYAANGFAPEGLELNANAAAAARARGFVVHEIELDRFKPAAPYDRAVLANVLEHVLDPRAALKDVQRILKPGGQVWISLPNGRSWLRGVFGRAWINWHVPFHITHFTAFGLKRLLSQTGFAVIDERQVTPSLWVAQSALARLSGDSARLPRRLRNPLLIATLMLFARGLLFPLWWIGNRLGRGDCLVVKARRR